MKRTTILAAFLLADSGVLADEVLPENEARAACEEEHLSKILRGARESQFRGYTDAARAEFAALGLDFPEPEPIEGLTESQVRELDQMTVDSLISSYRASLELAYWTRRSRMRSSGT